MKCLTLGIVLIAAALLVIPSVRAVFTIKRNPQDCIYPRISANAEQLWPTKSYLPKGTTVSSISTGGLMADTSDFRIEYYGTYKVVTNKLVNERYLLYHCGTVAPTGLGINKVFQIPLTSGSVADTTAADYATQLTVMDRVAFSGELAVSGCLQALAACGYIAPDDPSKSDLRKTVDSFWVFGSTDPPNTDPMSIAFNAPAAVTPLDRTRWLVYVSAFYNKEAAASALYLSIRDAYNSLRREALAQRGTPPNVCWVYKDYEGDYAMTFAQYKVQYVKDAGGQMLSWQKLQTDYGMVPKPAGSTTNLVLKKGTNDVGSVWGGVLTQCDIIIDESYVFSTGGLTEMDAVNPDGFLQMQGVKDYATQIPAVMNKQVYSLAGTVGQTVTNPNSLYAGSLGLDWFERGVSRCDEVLRDMIKVIRPTVQHKLLNGWTLRFLLQLDGKQQQQKVIPECRLATAKLNGCVRSPYAARICPNGIRDCNTGVMGFPPANKRCAAVSAQNAVRAQRKRQVPKVPECVSQPTP